MHCFADPLGSKPVFISTLGNSIVAATEYDWIIDYSKRKHKKLSLNIESAYMLLSFGFMIENNSIIDGVGRLMPGYYAYIFENRVKYVEFYNLKNNEINRKKESEYIDGLDYYFTKAIISQFEKDKEYGYKHLVALSGGLDSRMTSMIAHELGYIDQLNITFSQSNYSDQTIAQKIASDLKHEWLFKALDNGLILYDIDKMLSFTGGNALYYGVSHSNSLFEKFNFTDYGLLHGGTIGDVVLSSYVTSTSHEDHFDIADGAYSRKSASKLKGRPFSRLYPNKEIYMLFNRGLIAQSMGLSVIYKYTEAFSPCYDLELLEYLLSVPLNLRIDHRLYKKWMLDKHPLSAKYKWAKTENLITAPSINIRGRTLYINQLISITKQNILGRFGINKYGMNSINHMNPIDYWLKSNSHLKKYLDSYYSDHIDIITDKELKLEIARNYFHGTGIEKIQVLTLLSVAKRYLD